MVQTLKRIDSDSQTKGMQSPSFGHVDTQLIETWTFKTKTNRKKQHEVDIHDIYSTTSIYIPARNKLEKIII